MIDHADPLYAEGAWLRLLHGMNDAPQNMQISLYQRFAVEYPSYAALCQERIQSLAAQLIEEAEG